MKKSLVAFIFLFIAAIIITGCKSEPESMEEPIEKIEENREEEEKVEVEVFDTFPLTGTRMTQEVTNRAFGVMIENSVSARPQSGLYQADLVYEVLAEGSITRFLAFFHSEHPEIIGPVRSARDYNILLNNGYDALYVSAGGSPAAFEMIEKGLVDHISGLTYDGRYFTRSSARKAPHNLYTSYENLVKAAEHANISLQKEVPELPFYSADFVLQGEEITGVTINYGSNTNTVRYEYDTDMNRYRRYNGGEQTVDLETNTPVLVDNILVVETIHRVIPGDKSGRREIDLTSGGQGYLVQGGVIQKVEWENVDGRILPKGDQARFLPGKTWINLVPSFDAVSIIE
ncbi:MAG: DUF3048 domain-containing protein [Bacillaceae bacterium]|nr:DUF3048 domain-containing protein [Bacillaceae bacterium]